MFVIRSRRVTLLCLIHIGLLNAFASLSRAEGKGEVIHPFNGKTLNG